MTDPIGTAQQRELIELVHAIGDDRCTSINIRTAMVKVLDALQSRIAEVERLREALTPSGATKAAYIGEFSFSIDEVNGDVGIEVARKVDVPWTTIKEIMAAILSRAALSQHRKL